MRINRGKLSLEGIAEKALEFNAEKVMVVDRWKGGVGRLRFFRIDKKGLDATPPIIYIRGIKLRRNFGGNMRKGRRIKSLAVTPSQEIHLEARKLERFLAEFFGISILSLDEAVKEKLDAVMQILVAPLNYIVLTFKLIPELVEIGPQIKISHLIWKLD